MNVVPTVGRCDSVAQLDMTAAITRTNAAGDKENRARGRKDMDGIENEVQPIIDGYGGGVEKIRKTIDEDAFHILRGNGEA